jgi:hypothetical protein
MKGVHSMNKRLQQVITSPMKTILAVRAAFDFCATEEDIREVIKKIPPKFGEFELLMISEEEGSFMIQNLIKKPGVTTSQIVSYDFYNEKEDLYYDYERKN